MDRLEFRRHRDHARLANSTPTNVILGHSPAPQCTEYKQVTTPVIVPNELSVGDHWSKICEKLILAPKAIYFLQFAASGSFPAYITLYYTKILGFTTSQAGILIAIPPLITLFSSPFWMWIAEKKCGHKKFMIMLNTLTVATLVMYMVPAFHSIGAMAAIVTLNACFSGGVAPLLDLFALHMLGVERRNLYGRQRVWGTVASGLSSCVMGVVMGKFDHSRGMMLTIYVYIILQALLILTMSLSKWESPNGQSLHKSPLPAPATSPMTSGSGRLRDYLVSTPLLLFLATVFFITLARSIISSTIVMYLSNYLHATTEIVGYQFLVSVALEIVGFLLAPILIKRYGPRVLIYCSMIPLSMRGGLWLLISRLEAAPSWVVLPIEFLQGATYAPFWSGCVELVAELSPPEYKAMGQSLVNAASGGIGSCIGNLVGTFVLGAVGASFMFAIVLGSTCIAGLCFLGVRCSRDCESENGLDERKGEMVEVRAKNAAMESGKVGRIVRTAVLVEDEETDERVLQRVDLGGDFV